MTPEEEAKYVEERKAARARKIELSMARKRGLAPSSSGLTLLDIFGFLRRRIGFTIVYTESWMMVSGLS